MMLTEMINSSNKIVFFGGAGVSVGSGIPDFRSANGLYTITGETTLSHHYFYSHPEQFYDFYWKHLVYPKAKPNNAHKALAHLEQQGKLVGIITQNVDGLHQKAGSKKVVELHGSSSSYHCISCHRHYQINQLPQRGVPHCECGAIIRPDVVLFDEQLNSGAVNQAIQWLEEADMVIVGGTSLQVYPAAGFLSAFQGRYFVLINKEHTPYDKKADLVIHLPIEEVLKPFI